VTVGASSTVRMSRGSAQLALDRRQLLIRRGQRFGLRAVGMLLLAVVLLIALFPPYFMTITALHPPNLSFNRTPTLFSTDLSLRAFVDLFDKYPFLTWMSNTTLVSVSSTVLSVSVATLAAYSLSRLRYPGRNALSSAVFFVYMFPATLLFIPIFIVLNSLHMLDWLPALVAVYLTFSVPFCIWLLKAYFLTIPRELEDAAMIDGCSRFAALRRIVLPVSVPGILTVVIFTFSLCVNEFIYAITFITSSDHRTISAGVPSDLIRGDLVQWGAIAAAVLIPAIPLALLYNAFLDRFIAGFTGGAFR
jgi:multiple sugar transport system permease protein